MHENSDRWVYDHNLLERIYFFLFETEWGIYLFFKHKKAYILFPALNRLPIDENLKSSFIYSMKMFS